MKPKVFIGCSSEAKVYAEAIHISLSESAKPTIWNQGQSVFQLSAGTLESLEKAKNEYDFAILVLTSDDLTESRGQTVGSPRDNVIFELGLFIGAIGRKRTFIVCDHALPIKIPSDLIGITTVTFDSKSDSDPDQIVSQVVYRIKRAINAQGIRNTSESDDLQNFIRIALIGSTTRAIESNSNYQEALKRFYYTFFDELDRTPFGINTCGPEPVRTVLFDLYRHRLEGNSRSQMYLFEQRIRWYWRKGGGVGINHEPPVFHGREAKDQAERRELEIKEAQIILALGGRTGTRDYLEELLAKHKDPSSEFNFIKKPILFIGWFGGEVLKFMHDYKEIIEPFTHKYDSLKPFDEQKDWHKPDRAEDLARELILNIRRLNS